MLYTVHFNNIILLPVPLQLSISNIIYLPYIPLVDNCRRTEGVSFILFFAWVPVALPISGTTCLLLNKFYNKYSIG